VAALSVIAAVIDKWASLTFLGKPAELYFDGIPLKTTTGTPQTLPSVNLIDLGTTTNYDFEHNIVGEATTFQLIVRANTLLECDQIGLGIKYNDAGIKASAGYDFGTLTFENFENLQMVRQSERRYREQDRDQSSLIVHRLELTYEVQVQQQ